MFNIDFIQLFKAILPYHKRKQNIIAWVSALSAPFRTNNDNFLDFRNDIQFKLTWTAQKIYLEEYLNQLYDPVLKQIFIDNVASLNYIYLFNDIEQQAPFYLYNLAEPSVQVFNYNNTEIINDFDYIINIPVSITFDPLIVRQQVDVYNAAGMVYDIQTF